MKDNFNESLHKAAINKLYQYGRELRQTETRAEKILWSCLRGRKFHGLKFRRQHPLDRYIADFYCHEKKLVIELDGSIHNVDINNDYDNARTIELADLNILVIRFKNEEVENNLPFVLEEILKICDKQGPSPSPQGEGVRG